MVWCKCGLMNGVSIDDHLKHIKHKYHIYFEENKVIHPELLQERKNKRKEYLKKYYEENKEEIEEYKKKYHQENKEKINERLKEYNKKYYQENKEKIDERKKNWGKQRIQCDICKTWMNRNYISKHNKKEKHMNRLKKFVIEI